MNELMPRLDQSCLEGFYLDFQPHSSSWLSVMPSILIGTQFDSDCQHISVFLGLAIQICESCK